MSSKGAIRLNCLWISPWPLQILQWQRLVYTIAMIKGSVCGSVCGHVPFLYPSFFFFFFFFTDGDDLCDKSLCFRSAFSVTYSSKKNLSYCQLWNESLKKLWAEWAPGVSDRGCLCCQSKAKQWLRLISILMNANWHICYGGLAVQTLQLAWLINYLPAGGSLEMEAGGMGLGVGGRKGDERAGEKNSTENCLKHPLHKSDSLFDCAKRSVKFHFTQRGLSL